MQLIVTKQVKDIHDIEISTKATMTLGRQIDKKLRECLENNDLVSEIRVEVDEDTWQHISNDYHAKAKEFK